MDCPVPRDVEKKLINASYSRSGRQDQNLMIKLGRTSAVEVCRQGNMVWLEVKGESGEITAIKPELIGLLVASIAFRMGS